MNRTALILRSSAALVAAFAVSAPMALIAPLSAQTPAQAPAQASAPSADLDRALAALRGISTMQAAFTQTDRNGSRVSGTLTLKRPGRIRFQYQPGVPMLIVSDGAAMTFIDYEAKQVQRWPIKNSPLGALLDPARDVKKYGRLISSGPAGIAIEVRDKSHPEYGVMTFRFQPKASAPGGLELNSWTSLDSQKKQTSIQLSSQRYGVAVSDAMFKYNDPRRPARR